MKELPKLLQEAVLIYEEPERSLMDIWLTLCCNCDKETFKTAINHKNEFILSCSEKEKEAVKIVFDEILKYRAERGLYYVKGSRL